MLCFISNCRRACMNITLIEEMSVIPNDIYDEGCCKNCDDYCLGKCCLAFILPF